METRQRLIFRPGALASTMLVLVALGSPAAAETIKIDSPSIDGHRLDWCYQWGTQCGKPAADAFCRSIGHHGATAFPQAKDIGDRSPTKVLGSGQICRDKICDGFRYIRCRLKGVALGNPNAYIPKKQKAPDPVIEDDGKSDSAFGHALATANLRNFNALANSAITAIANSAGSGNAGSLIRKIEDRCSNPDASCHLKMKLQFLKNYLDQ